jgi:hypothetical protein
MVGRNQQMAVSGSCLAVASCGRLRYNQDLTDHTEEPRRRRGEIDRNYDANLHL